MKQLKKVAAKLDDHGRNGDTIVAHINPREAALLKALGGSATVNPKTGLLEFFSESDPMGSGSDYGYGGDSTDSSRAASENATNSMVADINAEAASPDVGRPAYTPYAMEPVSTRPTQLAGPSGFSGWAGDKVAHAINNPVATALNFATSFTPVGALNSFSGLVGGPTVGGALTAMGRGLAAPETQVAGQIEGKTTGAIGPSGDKQGDKSGEGGDGYTPTKVGPSGSGVSPLAQALMGEKPASDPWANMGRRKTFGSLVNSYSPYGRQYVTPWDYRG